MRKYHVNNLEEMKTFIGQQITRDPAFNTMKINHSAFIQDIIVDKNLSDINVYIVPMKVGSTINMIKADVYKEEDLQTCQ